jgi:hypothetical protein
MTEIWAGPVVDGAHQLSVSDSFSLRSVGQNLSTPCQTNRPISNGINYGVQRGQPVCVEYGEVTTQYFGCGGTKGGGNI